MHWAILRFLLRAAIFVFATAWNLAVGVAAFTFIGVYVGLLVTGEGISLNDKTLPFWPESLRSIEIYYWGRPWYLGTGLALLFFVLPLSLALLERIYVALRGRPDREAPSPDGA